MTAANCTENRLSSWNTALSFYQQELSIQLRRELADFLNKLELNVESMLSFLLSNFGMLKKTSTNKPEDLPKDTLIFRVL